MRDDLSAVPGDPGPNTEARHGGDAPMRDEDTDALSGGRVADLASGAESEVEPPTNEQVAATAQEFVAGLVEAMGLECSVSSSVEDGTALVNVTGEGLGVLIGRRGQTLDALQEVTRTAVQRRLRSRVRLNVDVEAYKDRRRASLAEYAHAMAQRAIERGTEIELEPMNAYERKIIHDAVSDIEGAASFSEGEEPGRKVIVRSVGMPEPEPGIPGPVAEPGPG